MTVSELIAQLQAAPQSAVVVDEDGDAIKVLEICAAEDGQPAKIVVGYGWSYPRCCDEDHRPGHPVTQHA